MAKTTPTTLATQPSHADLASDAAELGSLSTADLRAELHRVLSVTAESLRRLAVIVRILEERGEDLSDLRLGLISYLRRIAYGQLVPELVVRYASHHELLRHAASLPMPDQERLANGEQVPLVVRVAGGQHEVRMADPSNMRREQITQVFGPHGLRDPDEQTLILDARSDEKSGDVPRLKCGEITVDRRRGRLIIRNKPFTPAEILAALAALHGDDPQVGALDDKLMVNLTHEEKAALQHNAVDGDTAMSTLVRRAAIVTGLFTGKR